MLAQSRQATPHLCQVSVRSARGALQDPSVQKALLPPLVPETSKRPAPGEWRPLVWQVAFHKALVKILHLEMRETGAARAS